MSKTRKRGHGDERDERARSVDECKGDERASERRDGSARKDEARRTIDRACFPFAPRTSGFRVFVRQLDITGTAQAGGMLTRKPCS